MMNANQTFCGNSSTIYVIQTTMLYTLRKRNGHMTLNQGHLDIKKLLGKEVSLYSKNTQALSSFE